MSFLEINNITKSYGGAENSIQVLKGVSASIPKGQMCVILGPSGSGKSTFLNAIGGLDTVDSGKITVENLEISGLNPKNSACTVGTILDLFFSFTISFPISPFVKTFVYANILQKPR